MKKIVFVTGNSHKISEASEIIGGNFEIISSKEEGFNQDIPETENSFKGNARLKVEAFRKVQSNDFDKIIMAEDSGLCVDALDGAPGIFSARYSGENATDESNNNKLLDALVSSKNREAHYEAWICLHLKGEYHYFFGTLEGHIAQYKSGDAGFGYDPIFIPSKHTKSLAELGSNWKNSNSHRYHALIQLKDFLNKVSE